MSHATDVIEREFKMQPLRERARAMAAILTKSGYGTVGVELDLSMWGDAIGYKIALYDDRGTRWYLVAKAGYDGELQIHGGYGCREDPRVDVLRKFLYRVEKAWAKTRPKKVKA